MSESRAAILRGFFGSKVVCRTDLPPVCIVVLDALHYRKRSNRHYPVEILRLADGDLLR